MPEKLLRAFTKIELNPAEQKSAALSVPVKDLAWYNADTKTWQVDSGRYLILIGNSSEKSNLQRLTIEVEK